MGAKNSKKKLQDTISISPVYEKSLSSNSDQNHEFSNNTIEEDITKEIKEEIILPIENESNESPEIIFETKQQLRIKNFFDNTEIDDLSDNDDYLNKFFPDDLFNINKSKSYVPKPVILEAPRLHSKASDIIFMSPFQLSKKSFGIVPKWNQKPNKIYLDCPKDSIDSKSCNDKEELIEEYLLYSETEKTTPNLDDFHDLLNCRKKMIKFRNSINYKHYHEYENILNCEDIIEDIHKNNPKRPKKKSFFKKHIKFQLDKDKDKTKHKNSIHNKRLNSVPFPEIDLDYDYNNNNFEDEKEDVKEDEKEDEKEDGLFILGVLERAAKERKRTKSVVVK